MKETAKLNATRSNDAVDLVHYKQLFSSVNSAITQGKKSYNTKAFRDNEGNSRMTWRDVKNFTSRKCWRNGSRSKDG